MQQILRRLHQQHIYAAFDQGRRLLLVSRRHVVETNVPQRRQFGRRPHRPRNKSRPLLGRKLRRNLSSQLRRRDVDLCDAIFQIKLAQHDPSSAEGISLDNVAPNRKESRMNIANDIRPAEHQHLAAVFFSPVIIQRRIPQLNIGPHRAVINHDAFLHDL